MCRWHAAPLMQAFTSYHSENIFFNLVQHTTNFLCSLPLPAVLNSILREPRTCPPPQKSSDRVKFYAIILYIILFCRILYSTSQHFRFGVKDLQPFFNCKVSYQNWCNKSVQILYNFVRHTSILVRITHRAIHDLDFGESRSWRNPKGVSIPKHGP